MNQPLALPVFTAYGIELEYMIVDRASLTPLPIADQLLSRTAGHQSAEVTRDGFAWCNELVLHQIEIKNLLPQRDLDQLAAGFLAETAHIDAMLAVFDARLMPAAMHPWMDPARETRLWPHQDAAVYRTYHRIFNCHAHGWANIQSMQLNLPFSGDAEFARLHAALRLLLPLLPALAASSPVADGRLQPMLDFRLDCYRFHPARVPSIIGPLIPDTATGRAQYQADVIAPIYREIAPHDPEAVLRHEWLNNRGMIPRFERNALELRLIDIQECPGADLAIAALVSAAAHALYAGRWAPLAEQQAMPSAELRRLLLACMRDAERAPIDNPHYLSLLGYTHGRCEAGELWQHLRNTCAADPLLSPATVEPLDTILGRGPLARRILRALGRGFTRTSLQAVYRQLCACLAAGRQFMGPAP